MICPSCHKDAPTILRGARPFCAACGAPSPLTSAPAAVSLAGQPARVGGSIARVVSVLALVAGGLVALALGGVAQLLWHTGLFVALPILVLTLLVSASLYASGRKLGKVGDERSRAAHERAIGAIAARQGGVVTVAEVAAALTISDTEADAMLTALAKRPDAHVSLELDDQGGLSYVFHDVKAAPRVRIPDVPTPAVRFATGGPPVQVVDGELLDENDEAVRRTKEVLRR